MERTTAQQSYTLRDRDGDARLGTLHTTHGDAATPLFMPIATQGAVKGAIEPRDIAQLGFEMILSNTYHLHVRPGEDLIARFGGLQRFMGWDGPILTDSGGFQAYSLAHRNQISEEGIRFQSHLDGSPVFLSPERAVEIQHALGIDVMMVLDECTAYPCTYEEAKTSMERSMRWAQRCKTRWEELGAGDRQHLFGIVQGSFEKDLREDSAKILADLDLPGYAVGGVVVAFERTPEALQYCLPFLPAARPRYLMGVGTPVDILLAVERGIDMFDCVLPTRDARHGKVFTRDGPIRITAAAFREDDRPIDPGCGCPVCAQYSRAYLRHLFNAKEALAPRLATLHNLWFYGELMRDIRAAIAEGRFARFKDDFLERYRAQPDEPEISGNTTE